MQGEAQGAVNGVKAVTEGIGPLAFAFLLAFFERTAMPGAPYLVASAVVLVALALSFQLPGGISRRDVMQHAIGAAVHGCNAHAHNERAQSSNSFERTAAAEPYRHEGLRQLYRA